MNTLNDRLDAARKQFIKCSGTAPQASCMITLAWNNGAEAMLKIMTEWTKSERLKLERMHAIDNRRS